MKEKWPTDINSEAGALGCVLGGEIGLLARLEADDFFSDVNREIFRACLAVQHDGATLDTVSVFNWLRAQGRIDAAGGAAFIASLPDKVVPHAWESYLEAVKAMSARRKAIRNAEAEIRRAQDLTQPVQIAVFEPRGKALGEFERPPRNDPNELLRHRYLSIYGTLLLAGPTGIGKSTLAMQCAILWALGRECLGIVPPRPLKSAFVQAENDDGELAELRDGLFTGLELAEAERLQASQNIIIESNIHATGIAFFIQADKFLTEQKANLFWIDPALSYLGGNASAQEDVTAFLRNGLTPLLRKHGCGCVIVHHTNKPQTGVEKRSWKAGEFAYLGSGSAEWANYARAVLALRSVGSHDVFELNAAKRGARLGWKDSTGEKSFTKLIAHAKEPGVFCWREVDRTEVVDIGGRPKKYDTDEMLALLPPEGLKTSEWAERAKAECGLSEATFHRERRSLEKAKRIHKSAIDNKWQPILSKPYQNGIKTHSDTHTVKTVTPYKGDSNSDSGNDRTQLSLGSETLEAKKEHHALPR